MQFLSAQHKNSHISIRSNFVRQIKVDSLKKRIFKYSSSCCFSKIHILSFNQITCDFWFSVKTRSGRNNVMTQDCLQIVLCNCPRQIIMRLLMGIIFITLVHLGSFKAIEDTQDSWTKHLRWSVLLSHSFDRWKLIYLSEELMTINNRDLLVPS